MYLLGIDADSYDYFIFKQPRRGRFVILARQDIKEGASLQTPILAPGRDLGHPDDRHDYAAAFVKAGRHQH